MLALLLYFALAVGVSFLCSLLEAVILSVSSSWVGILRKSGRRSGEILHRLKSRMDRPLAAILTLNTIANTVGAAGVGAQAFHVWGEAWVALASAVLTLTILVVSEIIPKTLGASYWRTLCPYAAYAIQILIICTYPAVILSEKLSGLISGRAAHVRMTREEMIVVAEQGETEGTLEKSETRVIRNLVRLDDIYVQDIMTPRSVILAMPRDWSVGRALRAHRPIPFSRIPVFGKDIDDIRGFVHRYRVLEVFSQGHSNAGLAELARPIQPILPGLSVARLLEEFIRRREHIFLVVDEYGGTAGLVTLEDAVETLLGVEIVDEFDSVEDMRKLARAQWEQRKREHEMRWPLEDGPKTDPSEPSEESEPAS